MNTEFAHRQIRLNEWAAIITEKVGQGKSGGRYQLPTGDGLSADEGNQANVWQDRGRQGYHFVISLKPDEGIPEIMYDVAMRFDKEAFHR